MVRRLSPTGAAIALLLAATMPGPLSAAAPVVPALNSEPVVHGFIVRLKQDLTPGRRHALAATDRLAAVINENALALRPVRAIGEQWQLLQGAAPLKGAEARAMVQRLRRDPRVLDVVPNVHEPRAAVPNDTLYASEQWWLAAHAVPANAGVPNFAKAWDRSTGAPVSGAAPIVAVLDSGYTSHPDLNANLVGQGYNFVSKVEYANNGVGRSNDAVDPGDALTQAEFDGNKALWDGCSVSANSSWHGTMIAGQLAAVTNNNAGVAGINWAGRVLPVRVAGKCGAAVADMVDGMRWAAGLPVAGVPANPNPARILVIGFAGVTSCSISDPNADVASAARLYTDTIKELRAKNVLIVAAAGNLRGAVGRPANCEGVMGVASVNRQGFKSIYSNFGSQIALAAPGGDGDYGRTCDALLADSGVTTTSNTGSKAPASYGYAAGSGTSFAAPMVAGVASLMLAQNPALTLAQLEDGLKRSARPHVKVPDLGECSTTTNNSRCGCTPTTCGTGLLDAEQALGYAANPASWVAPTAAAA
ncbi:MAG: S8 family serine peptidase, partial [Burkholderiaceae bacterium]|nr:S8 family serine peptidase [Burkholderiaceae bacterium]